MNTRRHYVMRARAESTEQTTQRILRATVDLGQETMSLDFGLAEVAARAEVSVQTVLRHFGSREALLDAAQRAAEAQVRDERDVRPGDAQAAVRVIVRHYERAGDWSLAMLATEAKDARSRQVTDHGRALHREWVQLAFAPQLARMPGDSTAVVDLLVVATDVYTWKLLRRDRALTSDQVHDRMLRLVTAIIAAEEE